MNSAIIDTAVFVSIGLFVGLAWFKFYVEPRDEFLGQVMDCMAEQGDIDQRLAYNICTKSNNRE